MGDRCYLRITLKREDLDRFGQYMKCKPGERWWDEEQDEPADGVIEVGIFEANYAMTAQRTEAAQAGLVFFGWHGEGGEYGGYEFASAGGEMLECATDRNGDLVLVLDHDLNVQNDLEHIRRYIAMRRQVRELMGIETQDKDAAPGISDLEYVADGGLKCPYCASTHVEAECAPVVETREAWQDVACCDCGRTWRDWYSLEGYQDLPVQVRRAA
jgi:hypothetical protein